MLGAILAIGSAIYSIYETEKTADENADRIEAAAQANAELDEYNATVAEDTIAPVENQYQVQLNKLVTEGKSIRSSQTASFAASGIDVNSGTASTLKDKTQEQIDIDAEILLENQKSKVDEIRSEAERYRLAAKKGLLLADYEAENVKSNADAEAATIAANTISKLGSYFDN